ncbi:MAG: NAD(P)-dependent oxidoreductase [Micrococcales bacterium]|nr:NAD(P)-dependent oxidoreductase [Micrococcales bacterium]
MRIVVVGLGRMGRPIAQRLAGAFEVVGSDAAPSRAADARRRGVRVHPGPGLPSGDVLLTVLPGPIELAAAVGDLDLRRRAGLWIDLTSCDPSTGTELHAGAGIPSVAAPMLGGPDDATRGTLGFHVGGAAEAVASAQEVLAVLGPRERVRIVGERPADAYLTKLLGNLLWFGQVIAVTEALLLARRMGLSAAATADVLADGPGASEFLRTAAPTLLDGRTMDHFGLDRIVEELRHLTVLAQREGIPFDLATSVTRIHEDALAEYGPRDGELLASTLLQRRAGIDFTVRAPHPPAGVSGDPRGGEPALD